VIEYEDSQCGRCVDIPLSAASERTKPSARVSAPDSSFLNGSVESRFAAARAPSGPFLRYEAVRWEGADPVLQSIRAVSLLI
jgi:hypothetical protein